MHRLSAFAAALCLSIAVTGCGHEPSSAATARSAHSPLIPGKETPAHAAFGPRGGQLIELGDEEYHAELLHDDESHVVTVYILDGAAQNDVGISAPNLTIHTGDDDGADYLLDPVQLDHDAQSTTFCYETTSAELCHALDEDAAEAELLVDIDGHIFRGPIEHSPAHGHDHEHEHSHAGRHAHGHAGHVH